MAFKGEVKRIAHISQENALVFYNGLKAQIEEFGDLYVEVQYQTTMQPNGKALFSAILIGRKR